MEAGDEDMTVQDVASVLGLSPATIRRIPWTQLPFIRTPGGSTGRGHRRYRPGAVEAFRTKLAERPQPEDD